MSLCSAALVLLLDGSSAGAASPLANSAGNKENEGVEKASTEGGGTLRVHKSAAHMNQTVLLDMKRENDSARSFLREVSSGRAGNDGPYFSPCRAKGAEDEKSIKNHPLSLPLSSLCCQPAACCIGRFPTCSCE